MTAKIQRYGRAAKIRDVLVAIPTGAATVEIKAAADLTDRLSAIGASLVAMRKSDQVTMTMGPNSIIWHLTPKTRAEIARMAALPSLISTRVHALGTC